MISYAEFLPIIGLTEDSAEIKKFQTRFKLNPLERVEDSGFIEARSLGFSLAFSPHKDGGVESLQLMAVHLYCAGHDGYDEYRGQLPGGIHFGESKDVINQKLGLPIKAGGGTIFRKMKIPRWEKFLIDSLIVHIQFKENDLVELITITTPAFDVG